MTMTTAALVLIAAAVIAAGTIVLLFPLLRRYALARPNARSSHRIPTPQGGGIAVLIAVVAAAALLLPDLNEGTGRLAIVLVASVALAIVGAVDDIRPIEPGPRLLLQSIGPKSHDDPLNPGDSYAEEKRHSNQSRLTRRKPY